MTFEKWLEEHYPEEHSFAEFGPYDMGQAWNAGFEAARRIIRAHDGRSKEKARRDERILSHVSEHPGLTNWEIAKALNSIDRRHNDQLFPSQVENSLVCLALDGKVTFGWVKHRGKDIRVWQAVTV